LLGDEGSWKNATNRTAGGTDLPISSLGGAAEEETTTDLSLVGFGGNDKV